MKFVVYKQWASSLLPATILWNVGILLGVYLTTFDHQKEANIVRIFLAVALIILNVYLFYMYRMLTSVVIFEEDAVKCSFLKRTRRLIPYKEIREYGVFWEKGVKYIYISTAVLSETERNKAFELYKKTKNVIVLQYNDEAMDFLSEHI